MAVSVWGSVRVLAALVLVMVGLVVLVAASPAPAPTPSPIWRLFGGFGGGFGGGYGQRGSRAYNGPPPEGPNEYKSICRVNNPDNYAFGPGHIPAGPVCPW